MVVRVHAQVGRGDALGVKELEAAGDDGARETSPAMVGMGHHGIEEATTDPIRCRLHDVVDQGRRSRAGPGDDHEVPTEPGVLEPLVDPMVVRLVLAPVLGEPLDHHLVDGGQLCLLRGAQVVPVRQVDGRDVGHVGPEHLGVPAGCDVAQRLEGRRELDVAPERIAGQMRGPIAGMLERQLSRAQLGPPQEALGDAHAPGSGIDDGDEVERAIAVVEVVPFHPGVAQRGVVPLHEDAVGRRVRVDEVQVVMAHDLRVVRLHDADPSPQGRVGRGHPGDVVHVPPAPEAEAGARGGAR